MDGSVTNGSTLLCCVSETIFYGQLLLKELVLMLEG
jgi:hypothetical protein